MGMAVAVPRLGIAGGAEPVLSLKKPFVLRMFVPMGVAALHPENLGFLSALPH